MLFHCCVGAAMGFLWEIWSGLAALADDHTRGYTTGAKNPSHDFKRLTKTCGNGSSHASTGDLSAETEREMARHISADDAS